MNTPLSTARPPVGEDVEIYVLSKDRHRQRSTTLQTLKDSGLGPRVNLVVPHDQGEDYIKFSKHYQCARVLKCKADTLDKTRRAIGERASEKFILLDDDLEFFKDARPHAARPIGEHFNNILILVSRILDTCASCAITTRQTIDNKIPGRPNRYGSKALAYRRRAFMQCDPPITKKHYHVDVAVQLAHMGYENFLIEEFICRQQSPIASMKGMNNDDEILLRKFKGIECNLTKAQRHALDDIL